MAIEYGLEEIAHLFTGSGEKGLPRPGGLEAL
jgi:hypothetical protein